MQMIMEYVSQSYITLMLLAGLTVILVANRKTKIEGTQFVWIIMGLVFVLTSCEYIQYWCVTYDKPMWMMYVKTSLIYLIYPLISLLELYLVASIRHKVLIILPFAVYSVIVILNMFGLPLIYCFNADRVFIGGHLRMLPSAIMLLYLVMLMIRSPQFIKSGNISKSMIVIFMTVATILTTYFELEDIVINCTDEIAAIDILVYYFYLSAIQHSKVQEELHQQELAMEKMQTQLAETNWNWNTARMKRSWHRYSRILSIILLWHCVPAVPIIRKFMRVSRTFHDIFVPILKHSVIQG